MVGGVTTPWRTILKGSIIRKDENPWPGFQNWFQDASWGRALCSLEVSVWPESCTAFPQDKSCYYCAVPKPMFPLSKKEVQAIHIHMPNQWTCQVNFSLQLELQRFIRKQDHTWEQVGWKWPQPTLTERRVIHVILVGFCCLVPASRFPSYGGPIYYCHIFRAFKCCKLVLCEYPEFLKYWHVTQTTFNQPFSVG